MTKYQSLMDFSLTNGTSKRGVVLATYDELVNAFGKPLPGDGEKTQAEWVLVFTDEDDRDSVVTIYDWRQDTPPQEVKVWNVGGFRTDVVEMVEEAIWEARELRLEQEHLMYQWDFEWAEEAARDPRH